MNKEDFKSTRQQKTNECFVKLLSDEVSSYQGQHQIEDNTTGIIAYLVKHNLIRQSVINQYVAVHVYPDFLEAEGGKKDMAVNAMANFMPLEPRQIYNLLGNHYVKFKPNKFKFP